MAFLDLAINTKGTNAFVRRLSVGVFLVSSFAGSHAQNRVNAILTRQLTQAYVHRCNETIAMQNLTTNVI
jgi:hypothetical protein